MNKYVYIVRRRHADGDGTMKDVLGGKGAGLAEMSRAGLPVPRASPSPRRLQHLFQEPQAGPGGDRTEI